MSGGSKEDKVTLPKFYETALQQQIGMAGDVSSTGYVPYYGPEVAAFSPQQQAAFQNTNQALGAFGMQAPTQQQQQSYMPEAQNFGGFQGYSSQPMYQQAVDAHAAANPAQAEHLQSFTINPQTGDLGANAALNQPVALEMQGGKRGK